MKITPKHFKKVYNFYPIYKNKDCHLLNKLNTFRIF